MKVQDNLDQALKWLHETETEPREKIMRRVPYDFYSQKDFDRLQEEHGYTDDVEYHNENSEEIYGVMYYWEERYE